MKQLLSPEEFNGEFRKFSSSALRIETLPQYGVVQELSEFQKYRSGDLLPENQKEEWCAFIRSAISAGKKMARVRVLVKPLTPYLKYEFEWGYIYTATAGEDIYVIERESAESLIPGPLSDFWILDDQVVWNMEYADNGSFKGAIKDDDLDLVHRRKEQFEILQRNAMPLRQYLAFMRSAEALAKT